MTESVKERIRRNYEEYDIWFESVFVPNSEKYGQKCPHFFPNSPFRSEAWTSWQKRDGFEIRTKICVLCGKTLKIETRKLNGV